jgi:cytochrome c-type biogenesis protein CcmH/NrfF
MAEGRDKKAIIEHFKDKYGEKILSSPTASGFNLAAWVAPFLLVAAGGVLVVFTVRRWGRGGARVETSAEPPPAPVSKEHQRILERELRQLDE